MGIIGDKLQEKITANNVVKYGDTIAEITYYNDINNTASIRFANPNGGTILTADNISFKATGGGLSQSAPKIGQKCFISFLSNNLLTPVITSLCEDEYYDNIYSKKNNADQGAYLVSSFINDINTESVNITPMINDYTDINSNPEKYTAIKDYVNTNATAVIRDMLMKIDKYKPSEDGITNINTNSTVKFKENGEIDVFVGNNTGIRINPNTKNISFFGKTLNTTAVETWTINVPDVIIEGNLNVKGNIKSGGEL